MTPEERGLIRGLFDRMGEMRGIEKDQDASDLINDEFRRNPDAPYLLTQSVLTQDQALQLADAQIRELEDQLRQLRSAAPQSSRQSSVPSTGLLGGATRTGNEPARGRTVDRATTGGGFMAQAMSTAAGVAGGMLLAGAISSLFGDDGANASTAATGQNDSASATQAANQNEVAEGSQAIEHQPDTPSALETQEDGQDDSFWGDWSDFGGDIDI